MTVVREFRFIGKRDSACIDSPYTTLKKLKEALIAQHEGKCAFCQNGYTADFLEMDHRIPLKIGGSDKDENFQLLCRMCHSKKTFIDTRLIRAAKTLGYIKGNEIFIPLETLFEFYQKHYALVQSTLNEEELPRVKNKDGNYLCKRCSTWYPSYYFVFWQDSYLCEQCTQHPDFQKEELENK